LQSTTTLDKWTITCSQWISLAHWSQNKYVFVGLRNQKSSVITSNYLFTHINLGHEKDCKGNDKMKNNDKSVKPG